MSKTNNKVMKNVEKSKFFAIILIIFVIFVALCQNLTIENSLNITQSSTTKQNILRKNNYFQSSNFEKNSLILGKNFGKKQNFSENSQILENFESEKKNFSEDLVKFSGNIEQFFTHQIVNMPEIAFNKENKYRFNFYRDCVTSVEFQRFLEEMNKNNYILVDIYDCYKVEKDKVLKKDLFIPKNKKPFILSFDDMSFDTRGKGMSDKLVLDENGKVASLTNFNGTKIEYDKEAIPILENFIEKNPNFSFNGARGIICPTGYNGILGYRIFKSCPNKAKEIEKLKPLVEKLKSLGYRFASHTYGHILVGEVDAKTLKVDTEKYNDEIVPIIGKTEILSFPCGSFTNNQAKLKILKDAGYRIFLCVGLTKQERFSGEFLYLKRHVLDGQALVKYKEQLSPIVDTSKIFDYEKRNNFLKTYSNFLTVKN